MNIGLIFDGPGIVLQSSVAVFVFLTISLGKLLVFLPAQSLALLIFSTTPLNDVFSLRLTLLAQRVGLGGERGEQSLDSAVSLLLQLVKANVMLLRSPPF